MPPFHGEDIEITLDQEDNNGGQELHSDEEMRDQTHSKMERAHSREVCGLSEQAPSYVRNLFRYK